MLQYTGDNAAARTLAQRLLSSRDTTPSVASRCHSVLGLVATALGNPQVASSAFQKAILLADESADAAEACRAQLNLLANVADLFGPHSTTTLTRDVSRRVSSLGDPTLGMRLRLTLARAEAQRGLLEAAERHHAAVASLLLSSPNDWLEGVLKLDSSSIAYLRSDPEEAERLALSALNHSGVSGHARTRSAALANLSFIHMDQGHLKKAQTFLEAALGRDYVVHELRMALLDSYAQLKLATGDLPSCERLLDEIDHHVAPNGRSRPSWYQPLFRLTRARLLLGRRQPEDAVRVLNDAIGLGARHSDSVRLRLLKTDTLIGLNRLDEATAVMDEVAALSGTCLPSISAEIDRVKGDLLARLGEPADGRPHLERAVRVLSVVGSACARAQAEAALARLSTLTPESPRVKAARPGVIDAAALLDLAPNPELLGREALALITDLECARGVALVATRNGLPLEILAHHGWSATEARRIARATEPEKRLALGELRGRRFYLAVAPKPNIVSRDALAGIRTFVETAVALESYRREERRQAALMPFEPSGEPGAVFLSDEMLKVVAVARRIAADNLPVLITGETGTGKGVLARLIHAASDRAEQAFVAFNCTGLPRDTAESQLFGHRRGSFTDAREDASGIIRGAAGGHPDAGRDRRAGPEHPAEAAPVPRLGRSPAGGRTTTGVGRRPGHRGDQRGHRHTGPRGAVP